MPHCVARDLYCLPRIVLLATDGVEQIQLAWPSEVLLDCGANVDLVSPSPGGVRGFDHREEGFPFPVDSPLAHATARDYDAPVLPGGVWCPTRLEGDARALRFLRDCHRLSHPIAAICQAPSVLAAADVVREKCLTSWPHIRPAIRRAGGIWIDQDVVVDGSLITCRTDDDLDGFCDALIGTLTVANRRTPGRRWGSGIPFQK